MLTIFFLASVFIFTLNLVASNEQVVCVCNEPVFLCLNDHVKFAEPIRLHTFHSIHKSIYYMLYYGYLIEQLNLIQRITDLTLVKLKKIKRQLIV